MAESIAQRINASSLDQITKRELRALFEAQRLDMVALAAKLNLDATVTDTNYHATPNLIA